MVNLYATVVLFAVSICTHLDVVSMQNPTSPVTSAGYYKESGNGDFAVRMRYSASEGPKMLITISYDTETKSASDFFKTQITADLIDGFSKCGVIDWAFNPCTISMFRQGNLACASETQCAYDKIHGCVATAFALHPEKMGKFLICVYSGKTTQQCATEGGLIEQDVEACVSQGQGAQYCNHFHSVFIDARTKGPPPGSEKSGEVPNGITNFKSATCTVLAQGFLKCDAVCYT